MGRHRKKTHPVQIRPSHVEENLNETELTRRRQAAEEEAQYRLKAKEDSDQKLAQLFETQIKNKEQNQQSSSKNVGNSENPELKSPEKLQKHEHQIRIEEKIELIDSPQPNKTPLLKTPQKVVPVETKISHIKTDGLKDEILLSDSEIEKVEPIPKKTPVKPDKPSSPIAIKSIIKTESSPKKKSIKVAVNAVTVVNEFENSKKESPVKNLVQKEKKSSFTVTKIVSIDRPSSPEEETPKTELELLVENKIQTLDDIAALFLPIPKKLELRNLYLAKEKQKIREANEAKGIFVDTLDGSENQSYWTKFVIKYQEKKHKMTVSYKNFKEDMSELMNYLVLWNKDINDIGCHFGNIVRSYFIFMRSVMFLNVVLGILYCFFLILPGNQKMDLEYSNGIECVAETQNSGSARSSRIISQNQNNNLNQKTCHDKSSEMIVVQPYHYLFSNFSFESLEQNTLARNQSIELEREYPPLGGYRFAELEDASLNIQKIDSSDDLLCYQETNSISANLPTFAGYDPFTIPFMVILRDFMSGTGSTENSAWFVGFHQPVKGDQSMTVPFTYIGIQSIGFIICFSYLLRKIAKGTTNSLIKSGEIKSTYINLTFAAWDFSITSKKIANLRRKKICGLLMEELKADLAVLALEDKSGWQKFLLYTKRTFVWTFFVSYLFFGIWSIRWSVMSAGKWGTDDSGKTVDKSGMPAWLTWVDTNISFFPFIDWLPQLSLMLVTGLGPTLFKALGGLEEYSDARKFEMLILRNSFIKLISISILVLSIIMPFQCEVEWPTFLTQLISSGNTPALGSSYNNTCLTCTSEPTCWENEIGREMYKIVFIDGIKQIFIDYLIISNIRAVVSQTFARPAFLMNIKGEFEIMSSILQIIHIQCMTWIGMFFCPILPIVMGIRMTLDFYTQKHMLFKLTKAPKRYCPAFGN